MSETALIPWSNQAPTKMVERVNEAVNLLPQVAPRGYSIDEFNARTALQFVSSPSLYDCTPSSVIDALLKCVSLGLVMGEECSLVKFGSDCTLMIEYQAYQRKFSELPGYKRCVTDVVREQDEFEYDQLEGTIRHKPNLKARNAKMVFAYCVIEFQNGERWFEVLDEADIDRHKRRAQGGGTKGPWATDAKEMWRKSAINALAARYQASIPGMTRQIQAAETAAQFEYQNTAPSHARYKEAVDLLYGVDEPRNESAWAEFDEHRSQRRAPQQPPRYYGVNPETGEVDDEPDAEAQDEPEPDITADLAPSVGNDEANETQDDLGFDAAQERLRLKADVEQLMRQKNFKRGQVLFLIKECGGGDSTPFEDLKSLAVLRAMHARLAPETKGESLV